MRFIHLSDPHIQKDDFHLFGLDPYFRLQMAIKSINKNFNDAKFIVITGDLTDSGDINGYKKLKKIIDNSKIEVILLMGNHDNRDNFLKVFKNYPTIDNYIQSTRIYKQKAFIFLDTKIDNTHSGDMSDAQFLWLEKELLKTKKMDTYIFMHHPPMDIEIPIIDKIKFNSSKRFKLLLKEFPNIKYLFFGHIHRIVTGVWSNIPYFGIRSTNHQLSLKHSTKHQYTTNEEKPAFGVVDIKEDNVVINIHEYLDEDRCYLIEE